MKFNNLKPSRFQKLQFLKDDGILNHCFVAGQDDKSLTLVRGHYYCPIWNTDEPHWWTVRKDGTIYDPTANQFPSKGLGLYQPFDGVFRCSECDKIVEESSARYESNYIFCDERCNMRFVGIFV